MKILSEEKLRSQIRTQINSLAKKAGLISEKKDDNVTDAELAKSLKTGASKIAKEIPTALNDEMAEMIQMLAQISDENRSLFSKLHKYVSTQFEKTQKKPAGGGSGGSSPDFVVD